MKVTIDASQEELDEKRIELIKAIAGTMYDVEISKAGESKPEKKKEIPPFKAQREMIAYWDKEFKKMLNDLDKDINEILG